MARFRATEREQALGDTRRRLINAAIEEFAHSGYDLANINHISQAAGLAKGTVYNYFPSKRALMQALIDHIAALHLAYVESAVREETGANCRLVSFYEAGFAFVSIYPREARLMIVTLNSPDEEFKQRMYQAYQPMFRLVREEILGAGIASGVFRDVERVPMTALLMTIYLGSASQVDPDGRPWLDHGAVAGFVLRALRQTGTGDQVCGVEA